MPDNTGLGIIAGRAKRVGPGQPKANQLARGAPQLGLGGQDLSCLVARLQTKHEAPEGQPAQHKFGDHPAKHDQPVNEAEASSKGALLLVSAPCLRALTSCPPGSAAR